MSTSEQFLIGMQAYQEIRAELQRSGKDHPGASATAVAGLANDARFPDGSLLLGFADDGLPVILDLYNPLPGPLLVAGEGGSGKTAVLQSIARVSNLPDPGDIQFAVITPFPEEWKDLETLPNSLGIWPSSHHSSTELIGQLVDWASTLSQTRQVVLLLIDGLDLFSGMEPAVRQDLAWLLANGPEGHVWPIVTANPSRFSRLDHWMDSFHTRIIGQVRNKRNAGMLVKESEINLADLQPGIQFGLSQPDGWMRFILPPLA